jgi:type I restriction enzyme, S subunit
VSTGDILLTIVGSVGNLAKVTSVFNGSNLTQQTARLAFNKKYADADFFLSVLESSFGQREILNYTKSGVQPSLNLSDVDRFRVPLPPLPEQRSIAQALSDVDALIAALDKLIAKKRHLKTATMQQLLTGKMRSPGFGEGKGYKQTEVGIIPEDWKILKTKEIAPLQRGFDLPTSLLKRGNYPVVYSNGVMNYHSEFMVRGPGVITGRSGTIGNVHYVSMNYWPHNTALWVTNFINSDAKYVYYFYQALKLERFGTGSGVPTLNRNDVHDSVVPLPPLEEQKSIAQILSDMDTEITALENRRAKTQAIKQGMMQELLTGRTRLV